MMDMAPPRPFRLRRQQAGVGAAKVGAVGDSPSSHVLLGQARKLGRAIAQLLGDVGAEAGDLMLAGRRGHRHAGQTERT